jgi:hypothetical protein
MTFARRPPVPTLAQRAMELRRLPLPGSRIALSAGRLRFYFSISPGHYGRLYDCMLEVHPGESSPRMFVLRPNLIELADGRRPPHLYDHDGRGFLLCLWWPKNCEWDPHQKLGDSYIPWTAEWLWYYEEWLKHGEWLAGGAHPVRVRRRWGRGRFRDGASATFELGVTP